MESDHIISNLTSHSSERLEGKSNHNPHLWKIMYSNARGIKGKMSSLIEHLNSENPQIFLITNTLLITNSDIGIDGYKFFGKARVDRQGGGIGILVRDDLINVIIPHIAERNIEMMWVSLRRKNCLPLFIGCYYGKQEARCNKGEIEEEMSLLSEEIQEYANEGDVLIAMDGNGKMGLLGEEKSRNGKLLEKVFDDHNLTLMNASTKCSGQITRQNTKDKEEISAIDFVVCNDRAEKMIKKMTIDEDGIFKLRGRTDSDHNTVIIEINVTNVDYIKPLKKVCWRLKAPDEHWRKFDQELMKIGDESIKLLGAVTDNVDQLNQAYSKLTKKIDNAARSCLGKTTIKPKARKFESDKIKSLRQKKREMKNNLKNVKEGRNELVAKYIDIQKELRNEILLQRIEQTNFQFSKMIEDKSKNTFWNLRKKINRNSANECLTVKNEQGKREHHPEGVKECMATFYEDLFKKKPVKYHPQHDIIRQKIEEFEQNREYEDEWYNLPPSENEIKAIINRKKNGKATTDFRNEMLKRCDDSFVKIITPIIAAVWRLGKTIEIWNRGSITSLWKGKGDRESLTNHRAITVSSTIGNILEEVIDARMEILMNFTQCQAGGRPGASTYDHLFLLRSLMQIAIAEKSNLIITFYDVAKAYDRADVDNMLYIAWQAGVRGKIWRLLRSMSNDLTATVKTRYGPTRLIKRENGGRQGSRLTGKLFAKQMDTLGEMFENGEIEQAVSINDGFKIGCLEWVDDVMTCTNGVTNQHKILSKVNEFAEINKLEWGQEKCQVMQVGKKVKVPDNWQLGEKEISNTNSYKYLGDIITNDGKNDKNILARENKMNALIRQINTTASSDVMRGIQTEVILKLYESSIIPSLLNNAESWTLTRKDETRLDQIGIRAIKRLFGLPTTSPNAAIIHTFGIFYITQIVDKKKFLYLHKLLTGDQGRWKSKMTHTMAAKNIGWVTNMNEKLSEYELETDWSVIKQKTVIEWRNSVSKAVLKKNGKKLMESCQSYSDGSYKVHTKTKHIHKMLSEEEYKAEPRRQIIVGTKQRTRTIFLAQNGMLQCGKNMKGTIPEICPNCVVPDNENHRLNACPRWTDANHSDFVEFNDIYSEDNNKVNQVINKVENVWEVKYANGRMKK